MVIFPFDLIFLACYGRLYPISIERWIEVDRCIYVLYSMYVIYVL